MKGVEDQKLEEAGELDKARFNFLDAIECEESRLDDHLKYLDEIEEFEVERHMARLSMPTKETIETIMRYETMIERQYYRAINQLERVQRLRLGDILPPPLTVDVSTDN